jgi:Phosphoribosylanthranilate isomerase
MKIKICGLFRLEDISYVNEGMPDYIGFVFAKSRRQVNAEQAKKMKSLLDARIKSVGVFVDAPPKDVIRLIDEEVIDLVQLHGSEDKEYMNRLKASSKCPIIKAVSVRSERDIIEAQDNPADYLLLDHGAGGTGEAFDWSMIGEYQKPFFLAGGIHAGNAELAIRTAKPYALDLSSGVETNGVKDRDKIIEIVRRVRNV